MLLFACLLHMRRSQLLVLCQALLWWHFNSTGKSSLTLFLGDMPLRWPLTLFVPRCLYTTPCLMCSPGVASPEFKLLVARTLWSVYCHAQHLTRYLTWVGYLAIYLMHVLVNEGSWEFQCWCTPPCSLLRKIRHLPLQGIFTIFGGESYPKDGLHSLSTNSYPIALNRKLGANEATSWTCFIHHDT